MAFKLTKTQLAQRGDFVAKLELAAEAVGSAVDTANSAIDAAAAKVNDAIDAYNEILADAAEFAENIGADAQSEIADKSERWQEGDRGTAATEWADAWEGLDLSPVDHASIELIDEVDADHAATLADAPDAAGGE